MNTLNMALSFVSINQLLLLSASKRGRTEMLSILTNADIKTKNSNNRDYCSVYGMCVSHSVMRASTYTKEKQKTNTEQTIGKSALSTDACSDLCHDIKYVMMRNSAVVNKSRSTWLTYLIQFLISFRKKQQHENKPASLKTIHYSTKTFIKYMSTRVFH